MPLHDCTIPAAAETITAEQAQHLIENALVVAIIAYEADARCEQLPERLRDDAARSAARTRALYELILDGKSPVAIEPQ